MAHKNVAPKQLQLEYRYPRTVAPLIRFFMQSP